VRERVLEALESTDLEAADPLLRGRFVFGLVVQHELQAQESLLQTLQALTGTEYHTPRERAPDRAPSGPEEITVPAGVSRSAVDERAMTTSLHTTSSLPYRTIARRWPAPLTVDDRGYATEGLERRRLGGRSENAVAPLGWEGGKGGWERAGSQTEPVR
jgi:hypothetical protein